MTHRIISDLKGKHFVNHKKSVMLDTKKVIYKHPKLTEFQANMEIQKQLFQTLELNQNTLRNDILVAEMDMASYDNQLGDSREPGATISNMMNQWGAEPVLTNKEIQKRCDGLWITLKEFEQYLNDSVSENESIIAKIKEEFNNRQITDRERAQVRIEALETALAMVKLNKLQDFDRLSMRLAEMESTLMNNQKTSSALKGELGNIEAQISKGFDFFSEKGQRDVEALIKKMQVLILDQQRIVQNCQNDTRVTNRALQVT